MFTCVFPRVAIVSLFSSALLGVGVERALSQQAQQMQYSSAHHDAERAVTQTLTGGSTGFQAQMGSRSAVSVAVADFDRDGFPDLVTGYALAKGGGFTLQRGNSAAVAPTGADFTAFTNGVIAPAFLPAAQAFALPVRPDFMVAADVNGDGPVDLLVAAKGDTNAYLLTGRGHGNFNAPQTIALNGTLTALTTWRQANGSSLILAGVCGAAGACSLQLLAADGMLKATLPLPGAATAIDMARLNGGNLEDIGVAAGGQALLFNGDSIAAGAPKMETLPVSHALTLAAGSYVYDARSLMQLAVLDAGGTLHVLARAGVDSHQYTPAEIRALKPWGRGGAPPEGYVDHSPKPAGMAWADVEALPNVGPGDGTVPMMVRGRLNVNTGADDLAVMSGARVAQVAHASVLNGASRVASPVVTLDSASAPVLGAALARLSPDVRSGLITADGAASPKLLLPRVSGITFYVNTTTDANDSLTTANRCTNNVPSSTLQCTLRDAINLSTKSPSGPNTINVPAGTYTITQQNTFSDNSGSDNYHFDVDSNVSIVGGGAGTTIINANQLDKVMSLNSSNNLGASTNYYAYSIALSGLTLENGKNPNTSSSQNYLGGNFDWEADNGSLSLTNVTSTGGTSAPNSYGGGVYGDNYFGQASHNSVLTLTGCTVSSNTAVDSGGGIYTGNGLALSLSSSTVTDNTITSNSGSGAGIELRYDLSGGDATIASTITNSTISNNTNPSYSGGGLDAEILTSITGSTFSGNSAGTYGGGILFNPHPTATRTVVDSTFTGNTGAIFVQSGTTPAQDTVSISYSRFHGNTASGSDAHTAVGVGDAAAGGSAGAQVTATDNWWGCNPTTSVASIAGTTCDTAGTNTGTTSTFSGDPFTSLSLTLSTTTPTGPASFSATGSTAQNASNQNSSHTAYTGTEDNALSGVAASLSITQHDGTVTNASATTLSSSDVITESVTPDTSQADNGAGSATVTVDGFAVTSTFTLTVLAPPSTTMAFGTSPIAYGGTTSLTYTITNPNSGAGLSGIAFTDTLPAGLVVSTPNGLSGACGGAVTAAAGATSVTLSGGTLAAGANCQIVVNVTGTTAGVKNNSVTVSATTVGAGTAANASVTVNPDVAVGFKITGLGPFTAPGAAGTATVTAVDAQGATVTTYTGTVHITSSDADATLPADYNYVAGDAGVHTFSVVLNTAGTWTVTATDTVSASVTGSETGIVVEDAIWILNGNMQLERLNEAGTQTNQTAFTATASVSGAIAFDNTGNAWVVGNGDNDVYVYNHIAGTVSSGFSGGGISSPAAIAIDGLGNAWFANGNNTVSEIANAVTAVTPSTGYQSGSGLLNTPTGLIIDNAGSVWVTNSGNNTVTKIIGVAAPVVTPTVTGTTNNTLGTRP